MPPWVLRGPHLQTIGGIYLPSGPAPRGTQQEVIELPDGDSLVIHVDMPRGLRVGGRRVVLLVHGLAGNHDSPYSRRLARKLPALGYVVVRLDQRGCGAGTRLAKRMYHAARSADLVAVVSHLERRFPQSPLCLCGFSLGGNLVLRMLCRERVALPSRLDAAFAIAPPIDLAFCISRIRVGLNLIYDQFFAWRLWREYMARVRKGLSPPLSIDSPPRSLRAFDTCITAPQGGYASVDEYYETASTKRFLGEIDLPTTILTAADDSLVPREMFGDVRLSPKVELEVVPHGGHLGFVSARSQARANRDGRSPPDHRWLDWRIVDWVESLDRLTNGTQEGR